MNDNEFKTFLINDLEIKNIDEILSKFYKYEELLISWNEQFNLTRILLHEEVLEKHFVDSLYCLKYFNFKDKKVADLGSGAGFPGLALAIVLPNNCFTLVESSKKKCLFLEKVKSELKLENVTIINTRIEEIGHKESFDVVVARALTRLNELLELAIPLLKINGSLIAYKNYDNEDEIKFSQRALKILRSKIIQNIQYSLPSFKDSRSLIEVKKEDKTPSKYPRNYSLIKSNPL